jgi:hypothetical protein
VRLKGIPEEVIFLFFNMAKTLINKGSCVIARSEVTKQSRIFNLPVIPAQGSPCKSRGSNLSSQIGQASRRLFYGYRELSPVFLLS